MKINKLLKLVGLFLVLYIGLSLLFQLKPLRKAHTGFYCAFGESVFNVINPTIYADFAPFKLKKNPEDFDVSFKIYSQKKHGSKLSNPILRKNISPSFIMNYKLRGLILTPFLFLISLILVTPGTVKSKLLSLLAGLVLFYIYTSISLSYRFENAMNDGNFEPEGFWEGLVHLVGGSEINEMLMIVAVIIWGIVSFRPALLQELKS